MLGRLHSINVGITPKLLAKNLAIVASAFVWYFLAYNLVTQAAESIHVSSYENLLIVGAGTAGMAISAVIGSLLTNRFWKRGPFLVSWMLAGVFLSLIPLALTPSSASDLIAVSALFGSYFGLGMPTAMGFFASSTTPENRGRTGGITFFAIGLSFFILGNLGVGSVGMASIVLAGIRLTGLILFFLLEPKEEPPLEHGRSTYKEVIRNRSFILYFVPWIMFNIVDYLTISVINTHFGVDFIRLSSVFESSLIAVLAIVTGFLIDTKGRKRLAIFGFAFLGIGYAFLGLSPDITGWIFYTIADGIAWGILNVTFLFALWGDIAQGRDNEKFYVMGALPYLFSNLMYLLADPIMRGVAIAKVFTFACIFLFLAVLPLIFAPETLSEKVMKDLELKTYLQKAQNIAAKAQEKEEKEEDSSVEFAVAREDEEEDEKLAEENY